MRVAIVGVVCHLSTQVGFAHKLRPHNISVLWPTSAVLFSVLVVAPPRRWWAYIVAAYCSSVIADMRAGLPAAAVCFVAAGIVEILLAAVTVRRFARGLHAFESLRGVLMYLLFAVLGAPAASAFIAALTGDAANYWFYWRAWALSEGLGFLTLAPAILCWMSVLRRPRQWPAPGRVIEALTLTAGLVGIGIVAFAWPTVGGHRAAALVYLPLPLLLWAAVRFGPIGVTSALVVVACLSISGAVHGRGPFADNTAIDNVASLQLFLLTMSVPLLFLGALIEEGRQKTLTLRESEARFRVLADTAPVMIWMAGIDKGCVYFNKSWLDFTGLPMQHQIGDGWLRGVHPEDRERCLNVYASAFDARERFEMEYRLRRADGEYRWVIDSGIPRSMPDGAFAGYIGSCLDMTDRKTAEIELQQQRRELMHLSRVAIVGELSGALAHELNQPLTAILSNAQAAQHYLAHERVDLGEIRSILDDIVSDDKRAGEVIRRVRGLLKKSDSQFQLLDVNDVIDDVLNLAHADLISRGIVVRSEREAGSLVVRGDRVQLQQVLLNLVSNACDAMHTVPVPRRRLEITASRGSGLARISVVDHGVGIPHDRLARLFEAFVTTKEHGLGLGLTICRSIVTAHGGELVAENNAALAGGEPAGAGATFHITLPLPATPEIQTNLHRVTTRH